MPKHSSKLTLAEYLLLDAIKEEPITEQEFQKMLNDINNPQMTSLEKKESCYIFFVTTILVSAIVFLLFGVF